MVRKLACVDAVWIRIERVDDGSSVEEFFDNETCLEGEYQSSVRGDPEFPLRRPAIVRYSQDRWPRETPVSQVGENYNRLLDRIGETALAVDRDPASIRLMGVTKRVGVERIREAIESGLDVIGENRLQEAEARFLCSMGSMATSSRPISLVTSRQTKQERLSVSSHVFRPWIGFRLPNAWTNLPSGV